MALLHSDSFDDRTIDRIGDRYQAHQYNVSAASGIYPGRTGNGLGLSTGILDVADHITWQGDSVQSLYVGIAWEQGYSEGALCSIRYSGTPQIFANLNSDRTISIIRYDGGANTVLATSSQTVPSTPSTSFFYVEMYGKISSSDGAYELRINGTRWLSASGVNTSSTGDPLANQVRITNLSFVSDGAYSVVDDFYIADDDDQDGAATIVGFAGQVKIGWLEQAANGATNQWVPNAGTNWEAVNALDDDTTYVATETDDAVDLYALEDLEIPRIEIVAVAVHQIRRKEDALYRAASPVVRVGSTNYVGTEESVDADYSHGFHAWDKNPATGNSWTLAQVNSLQAGIKASV